MKECAIVTGGTKGIGCRICELLVEDGLQVFATYRSSREEAEALEQQSAGAVTTTSVDGSNLQAVQEFYANVTSSATPVILINNAGVTGDGLLLESGQKRIAEVMNNNFLGTVNFSLTFLESMMSNRHGNIVNVSSSAAQKVKLGNCAYGCSKIAIERFSKGLALEAARFNVFVNCIAPGFVETEMFTKFVGTHRAEIVKAIPTRKVLSTDQVARVSVDLATRHINTTGSVLTLGNGEQVI